MEAYDAKGVNLTIINCTCRICKIPYALKVKKDDYADYCNNGKLIQNCFPYLTAGERELIISGICDTCFNKMFKNEVE